MLSRRSFLKQISAGLFYISNYSIAYSSNHKIRSYTLVANEEEYSFKKNSFSDLWLFNKSSPGPLITAYKGEILNIQFINNLNVPTSIHWHGIKNINSMDGVSYLTQNPVQPGNSFIYRIPINEVGTFWYHAHNESWKQVAKGLYGPLITKDKEAQENEHDIVITADDWRLDKNHKIDNKSFESLMDWSHAGRLGNWLTINGKKNPIYNVFNNSKVKLRFINASNARILKFKSNLKSIEIVALDGYSIKPISRDNFEIGPGQRVDVSIEVRDVNKIIFYEISNEKPLKSFELIVKNESKKIINDKSFYSNIRKLPSLKNANVLNIHMQGGAMGNLSKAKFNGIIKNFRTLAMEDKKLWAFNKQVGDYKNLLLKVNKNETVILNLWNDSRWPHAMHLHGHHFFVKSKFFTDDKGYVLRDTYLMEPNEKAELIFCADNKGKWLFHCHMLEHAVSGMVGYIEVI